VFDSFRNDPFNRLRTELTAGKGQQLWIPEMMLCLQSHVKEFTELYAWELFLLKP
jgi:hypothetical protein